MKKKLLLSHLIYKVNDLEQGVKFFKNLGFSIEYGSKSKTNAIIYFRDKTYIEIRENMGVKPIYKFLLKVSNRKEFLETTLIQDRMNNSFLRFSLYAGDKELLRIKNIYKEKLGKGSISKKIKRVDTKNNILECSCFFPNNANYIFYNSQFTNKNIWNVKHENKICGIRKIVYGIDDREKACLNSLDLDLRLEFIENQMGIKNVEFLTENGEKSNLVYLDENWYVENNKNNFDIKWNEG